MAADTFTSVPATEMKPVDPVIEQMTSAQLLTEINKLSNADNAEPKVIVPPVTGQEQVTPVPAVGSVATDKTDIKQNEQTVPILVDQTGKGITFDELSKRAGFKSADTLADSYIKLQKAFSQKSEELAKVKQQVPTEPPAQQVIPVQPAVQGIDNDAIIRAINSDAIGVISAVVRESLKPLEQERYQNQLKGKVVELCNNPETADFGTPEIQDRIVKILEARPQYRDNLADNLEDIYFMAKGQVAKSEIISAVDIGKQIANQQIIGKNQAVVEGANNKPGAPAVYDPNTADLATTKKVLETALLKGGQW